MRLMSRENIHAAFGIPLSSVDERMRELGVVPYLPRKRGRGWKVQYDADEIEIALENERESQCKMRQASCGIKRVARKGKSMDRLSGSYKEFAENLTLQLRKSKY